MSNAVLRDQLRPLHVGPGSQASHLLAGVAHLAAVVTCIAAWEAGLWPISILLWPVLAWMGHAALSRLHESAHRMLFRSRTANEMTGIMIGTLALIPLSVYRYVHYQHHAYLGREKDPEFWPYNLPTSPRWQRLTYAWLELTFGWIFTPVLYSLRTARAWPRIGGAWRRRLVIEWSILIGFWAAVLFVVNSTNVNSTNMWRWFLVGHLAPAWIAGTMQTIRKFTEHLGRFGDSILEMTRTVYYQRRLGRAASRTQLHVDHHGTHHRWPRIPYHKLPRATPIVHRGHGTAQTFPSHFAAVRDMLPHLLNPRLGPQWKERQHAATDGSES